MAKMVLEIMFLSDAEEILKALLDGNSGGRGS